MPSLQAKLMMTMLQFQPYGWAKGSIKEQRSKQEKSTRFFRIPKKINCLPINIHGVSAEWISCTNVKNGVILYLHGGAYALGSVSVHREYLSRFAIAAQRKILAINYRLAPEHPFPAALDDTLTAYRWLISQGIDSSEIVIAGDSAGGGLALSTLISLRDAGDSLPACAVCISPWTDLTLSGNSIQTNAVGDPILSPYILERYAKYYAGDLKTNLPLISPLFAALKGLPPLLIHVGTSEILLDDANRLFENAQLAGVDVNLETWEGMFHVFQIISFIPETKQCLDHIAGFISKYIDMK
jgi:monoterpene epsilon-lactone hydrolase